MRAALATMRGCWTPIGIIAFAALFLWMSYHYPPDARAMPVRVGWVTLALAAVDLAARSRTVWGAALMRTLNPAGDADVERERPEGSRGRQALGIAMPLLFTAVLVLFGILCGAPLFLFAAIWLPDRRRWAEALLITAIACLFIWLIFAVLLKLSLFPGLLCGARL